MGGERMVEKGHLEGIWSKREGEMGEGIDGLDM